MYVREFVFILLLLLLLLLHWLTAEFWDVRWNLCPEVMRTCFEISSTADIFLGKL